MKTFRRLFALALIAVAVLSVSACGTGTVAAIGMYALGHTKTARRHPRAMNTLRCGYHSWRLVHDIRSHHHGWAAFQGVMTARSCYHAIKGPRRR